MQIRVLFMGLIWVLGLSAALSGQRTIDLDRFDIFEMEGKVHFRAVISEGNTCDGIRYLRSEDGVNFKQIGVVTGICGSPDFPVGYDFVDENPLQNTVNYYRVEFGGYNTTEIYSVNIFNTADRGYKVVPNPANWDVVIYFENPGDKSSSLVLFDERGQFLLETNNLGNTFELNLLPYSAGAYFFVIKSEDMRRGEIKGTLIIQR
nr:T9SS type A sorting domain-containing protein [Saprospiraceae bacterium]